MSRTWALHYHKICDRWITNCRCYRVELADSRDLVGLRTDQVQVACLAAMGRAKRGRSEITGSSVPETEIVKTKDDICDHGRNLSGCEYDELHVKVGESPI